MNLRCPHCGTPLPAEASFCPHCAQNLRTRHEVDTPVRRWLKPLRRALLLLVLAHLPPPATLALSSALDPDAPPAIGHPDPEAPPSVGHPGLGCGRHAAVFLQVQPP